MKKLISLFLFVFVFIGVSKAATTYFVDGAIASSGDGLSWAAAKKTLAEAGTLATTAGDNIYVRGGNYSLTGAFASATTANYYGGFDPNSSNTDPALRPLSDLDVNGIIEPWEFSSATTLSSTYSSNTVAFRIQNTGYTFNGFTITHTGVMTNATAVLRTLAVNSNCTFTNNTIKNCNVTATTANNTITSNTFGVFCVNNGLTSNCLFEKNTLVYNGNSDASPVYPFISVQGTSSNRAVFSNCVVRNNKVTLNYTVAVTTSSIRGGIIALVPGTSAIISTLKNCVVHNNEAVYTNTATPSTPLATIGATLHSHFLGSSTDSILNNTIANNKATNITCAGYKIYTGAATTTNHIVQNNVFWNNQSGSTVANIDVTNLSATSSVMNNYTNGGNIVVDDGSGTRLFNNNYNLYDYNTTGNAPYFKTPTTAVGNTTDNSSELSVWKINNASSFLIGKGVALTNDVTDKNGNPFATPRSVGAYEYLPIPVITFTQDLSGLKSGDSPVTLSATTSASSNASTITFSTNNSNVITVSGNTLTVVGPGTAVVTASQAANSYWDAASSVSQNVTVMSNPGFEDAISGYTIVENSKNVLRRISSIQATSTSTTQPTSSAISVTNGMWVCLNPKASGYLRGIVVSSDYHAGSSSLNLSVSAGSTATNMDEWSNAGAQQKVSLLNTQKYAVSFWAKADGTANNQCASVTVYITDNTLKTKLSCVVQLTGGTNWTQYSAMFDIPSFKAANPTADFSTAYFGAGITTSYDPNTLKTNYSGVLLDDFLISATNSGSVVITTSATNGTVTGNGAVYVAGTSATVVAAPSTGYRFVNWTESGNSVSTNASYTFTATTNRTLVANFEAIYNIAASAGTGGVISSGSGTYLPNSSATVVATPSSGYHFLNWTEGGSEVSTNATYTFTASANRTLVANFEPNTVPVSSGTTNASSIAYSTSDVTVAAGAELVVDVTKTLKSVTVAPGAKVTVNDGVSLNATNGITLQNTASATASFVDSRVADNPSAIAGTVEQAITETNRNWYVAVPVTGKLASDITLSGARIVQRNEALSRWDDVLSGTTLTPGVGYIAVASASSGTTSWSLNGNLNSGKVEVGVTRSGASSIGFNLLGNPYPSYLNWEQVLNLNATNASLLQSSIWYRTKSGASYAFQTYNSAGRVATPTSTTGYIPPMQAFWVRANAAGTVTFTNAMRSHGDGASNKLKAPKVNTQQIIRLQVSNAAMTDEAVVYIDQNAQNTFDKYDTEKMFNNVATQPELYTKAGTEKLVINGLNEINDNQEIPLGLTYTQGGDLKLKLTELSNFDSNTKVYLRDKQENSETELTPAMEYAFSTTATTNNESRFSLLFKAPGVTTGTTNANNERVSVFVNTQNQITIIALEKSNYAIYNAMGQMIENGVTSSNYQTSNFKLQTGVYLVKVNNQSTRVILK